MGCFAAEVQAPYLQDLADCVTRGARWSLDVERPNLSPLVAYEGDFVGVVQPCRNPDWNPEPNRPQEKPEPVAVEAVPEACPEAVASVAAQLLGHVQQLAKAGQPGRVVRDGKTIKPRAKAKPVKAEPVAV